MESPAEVAARMNEFFADRVPGQLGCVMDHVAPDLVVGHIDVTPNLIAGTGFLAGRPTILYPKGA